MDNASQKLEDDQEQGKSFETHGEDFSLLEFSETMIELQMAEHPNMCQILEV